MDLPVSPADRLCRAFLLEQALAGGPRDRRPLSRGFRVRNKHSIWHDETKVDLARKLFAEGKSAGAAAAIIGITRNAMIGKWHRMGLLRGYKRPRYIEERRTRGPQIKPTKPQRAKPKLPPLSVEELPPPAITDIARVSLMDLERFHCRWPVGEPTAGFCGCKPIEGLPYCEPHARRAYTPATLKAEPRPSFNVAIRKPARDLVNA